LYTSTCGGHTEDASEILPELAAPYLVGVACAPEARSRKKQEIVLEGARDLRDAPSDAAEAAALLSVHDVVPRSALSLAALASPVRDVEASSWLEALGSACG